MKPSVARHKLKLETMMEVNLPEDIEALVHQRAAAAGFPNQIAAYVAHLVKADATEDYGSPVQLSVDGVSKTELDSMINLGIESGPASSMSKSDCTIASTADKQILNSG